MSIRLMHIVLSLNIGGLERVVINLLKGLDPEIYTQILCCLEEPGALIHEVNRLGVKTISLKKGKGIDYLLLAKLAKVIRQEKIDIIHSHNPTPYFYGVLSGKLAGVPVIIHTRHGRNTPKSKREIYLRRFLSCMTDRIVAVSNDSMDAAINREKIPSRKVVTIFNGIDIERYRPNIDVVSKKKELGILDSDQVIGIVARLSSEKDHSTLLDAFRIVLGNKKNIKLVIVGDGNLRGELQQKAQAISVGENTVFLGERHDVPDLLAVFDLFVLSSLTEGISLTLLEAMAAGLPVVATDVGGNAEVVMDSRTGLIVPPADPRSMANAILKIIRNSSMAKQMGILGRERVSEKFSTSAMVRKYDEIYRNAVL